MLVGAGGQLLGRGHTLRERTALLLRIVGDLLDAGAEAGDLTDDLGAPFAARGAGRDETLTRIKAAVEDLGRLPEPGEICWCSADDGSSPPERRPGRIAPLPRMRGWTRPARPVCVRLSLCSGA